eukprot:10872255-Alexandrium_andersonii.AAC.1
MLAASSPRTQSARETASAEVGQRRWRAQAPRMTQCTFWPVSTCKGRSASPSLSTSEVSLDMLYQAVRSLRAAARASS